VAGPRPATTFLCFRAGAQACAVAVESVAEIVPLVALRPLPGAPAVVEGAFVLRGDPVAVISLRAALGAPPRSTLADLLVVCRVRGRRVALHVDEVLGLRELDAAPLRDAAELGPGVRRVAAVSVDDEELLFVHDLDRFLDGAEAHALERALDSVDAEP
jgi:chemotaxis signal transduction protein